MAVAVERTPSVTGYRPTRSSSGRYASYRDPYVLLIAVPEVARIAVNVSFDPTRDPASLSQREWNANRHHVERRYGHLPQANEICRQLHDHQGRPWPWRDLLAVTLDEARDAKKTYEERLSEPDRQITEHHAWYALNRVADHLRKSTLLPHEY